jgi:metallo-beta-lactamase family protein
MSIQLRSLGAAGEVTGSKHLLEVDGHRILVDCGAFQGRRRESDEKNKALLGEITPESIEAVVLTHAHFDHCGMLPLLVKRGFNGSIYSTSATRDLANLVMMDSAHIQARDAEYLAHQAEKNGKTFDWKPLYDDLDVVKTMERFITVNYRRPISVADGISIEFFDAGHILGSSLVRMKVRDSSGKEKAIGFSGDLGRKDKPIINDPECLPDIDYLVLESTYGDKLHENASDALEKLASVVTDTAARGGKIIIPAFAVERTQELIFHLHLLQDQGKIPELPIWVDSPMAIDATAIFKIHPECYDKETRDAFIAHSENPFGFAALHFSRTVDESKALNEAKGPMIVISADGMCEVGRIQHHLMHNLENSACAVLIVGFMAEGTLGRKLKDGIKEVSIHGSIYSVKAKIVSLDAFSAHADWKESLEWLECSDRARLGKIFLVHGEHEALTAMKSHLETAGNKDVEIVASGITYNL